MPSKSLSQADFLRQPDRHVVRMLQSPRTWIVLGTVVSMLCGPVCCGTYCKTPEGCSTKSFSWYSSSVPKGPTDAIVARALLTNWHPEYGIGPELPLMKPSVPRLTATDGLSPVPAWSGS